ncbi:hypothetical protein DAEQUDRAFT_761603 [Daedalea quercina L-15889]|uniref:Mid2 domain-containing protein n=1 Tax=Daedalea quercina L-15889 TaxID=1314783 RepID=A0A165TZ69_9APHY|nr:hypothetical protein DAEQUDRAFT_761603 [Daedalea quercina L-15889]
MRSTCVHVCKQGLLVVLLHSLSAFALLTNRTIDDTYGDLVTNLQVAYTSNWNPGQACSGCAVQPNKAEAFSGTWHDTTSNNPNATSPHSATLQFNGTAIWVNCILVNSANSSGTTIFTNISFELDGAVAGTYDHVPDPSASPYLYNITTFSNTNLDMGEHTLVMTALQGSDPSLLLFDWAQYTFDDGQPTSTSSSFSSTSTVSSSSSPASTSVVPVPTHKEGPPAGAIAGGVAGGAAFIILGICLILYFRRRRHGKVYYNTGVAIDEEIIPFDHTPVSGHLNAAAPFHDRPARRAPAQPVPRSVTAYTTGPSSSTSSDPVDAVRSSEKRAGEMASPHREDLMREAADLRQQVTNLRVGLSFMDMDSVAATSPPASSISAAPQSPRSNATAIDAELRRELASLRVDMARLRAGIVRSVDSEPLPAYM